MVKQLIEWVRTDENLPKTGSRVFTSDTTGFVEILTYNPRTLDENESAIFECDDYWRNVDEIEYWAEIPKIGDSIFNEGCCGGR